MKNILLFLWAISIVFFTGCEEVINVDLETQQPRLVIDAYIKWYKDSPGNEQVIRLSLTGPYYNNSVPAVSGALVVVTDENGDIFNFTEDGTTGLYRCTNFNPMLNSSYTLTVSVNGETYTANEIMKPAPDITNISQEADGGFTGDQIEVRAFFTDNGATDDYYLFRFKTNYNVIPVYDVIEDRFINGNQIFALFSDENLSVGSNVNIQVAGISERYHNYMNVLTGIAGSNSGSPFSTPPATVRGNVVNATNEANFALGYFALSQVDSVSYIVQ
jgi:hypothetical protein